MGGGRMDKNEAEITTLQINNISLRYDKVEALWYICDEYETDQSISLANDEFIILKRLIKFFDEDKAPKHFSLKEAMSKSVTKYGTTHNYPEFLEKEVINE